MFNSQPSETIGAISRLDYGSPGFRNGLIELASQVSKKEGLRFIVLAGGLVSFPHLRKEFTTFALRQIARKRRFYLPSEDKKKRKIEDLDAAREWLLDDIAKQVARVLPKLRNRSGHFVRLYIVTSPAPNYDGWIGQEIAQRLRGYGRRDIRYMGEGSARISLKNLNKVIGVLVPEKASWRSKYFSTAVDRLIEDEEKQTSQPLPDLWLIGCTASSLLRPRGERKRSYVSVPALHRLKQVHTAENQVGIRVLEFQPTGFLVRTYNFKDYTAQERRWVPDPEGTPLQKSIVAELKNRGAMTIGMFEDVLRVSRREIANAIRTLNESEYRPAIRLDSDSDFYDFDSAWIQNKLKYPLVSAKTCREDVLLNFGCLHAGSIYSEYEFFLKNVPQFILQRGANVLVGAGDLIEGLEHDLDKRGESMRGWNYTDQENLAAKLIGRVMLRVFKARLTKAAETFKKKPSARKLKSLVESSLITFLYREGNHDTWVLKRGVVPLSFFGPSLVSYLTQGVAQVLKERGWQVPDLLGMVEAKVRYGEVHTLPSGLGITLLHPFMARAMTSSLRAQHTLDMAVTPVVVLANFHVAISVDQWDSDFGQRVSQQVGSIVWKTEFEHGKLKTLDVGVGYLRILSCEGRILMTESAFFNDGVKEETHRNDELIPKFLDSLGNGS